MQFAYVSSRALMFPPNAMIRGELDLVNRRQTSHSYAQGAGRGTQEDACTISSESLTRLGMRGCTVPFKLSKDQFPCDKPM